MVRVIVSMVSTAFGQSIVVDIGFVRRLFLG
jgi:hypothetical protein